MNLEVETYTNGKVKNGTFSATINGHQLPTAEGIAIIIDAFEIQNASGPYVEFTEKTRDAIAEKYGTKNNLMILGDVYLGTRINRKSVKNAVNKLARDAAWSVYTA